MKLPIFIFVISTLLLSGCMAEKNYRGVSEAKWQHLTAEQKQLIVDEAFKKDTKQME